jgi:hypothetical protein
LAGGTGISPVSTGRSCFSSFDGATGFTSGAGVSIARSFTCGIGAFCGNLGVPAMAVVPLQMLESKSSKEKARNDVIFSQRRA